MADKLRVESLKTSLLCVEDSNLPRDSTSPIETKTTRQRTTGRDFKSKNDLKKLVLVPTCTTSCQLGNEYSLSLSSESSGLSILSPALPKKIPSRFLINCGVG